jgi:hypothetical protein
MKSRRILLRIPVFSELSDNQRVEVGRAVVMEDGSIGIRFHETDAGNKLAKAIFESTLHGLSIGYESSQPGLEQQCSDTNPHDPHGYCPGRTHPAPPIDLKGTL